MNSFMRGPQWPLKLFVIFSASLFLGCSGNSSGSSSGNDSSPSTDDPEKITKQELQKLGNDLPSKYQLSPEEKALIDEDISVSDKELLGKLIGSSDEEGSL